MKEAENMSRQKLTWEKENVPEELQPALTLLTDYYPIVENGDGIELRFKKADMPGKLEIRHKNKIVSIEYGSVSSAIRATGYALAGEYGKESTSFDTLGVMLDCSRNAVMQVPQIKKWLCQLALMGYNMFMLYTEDTYKLPGEPFWGYKRGAYTMAEIKELDDFARRLGIEMIACIQTLGHLEQVLKWNYYRDVKDTSSVLMVDNEKTYALIEKMIAFWSEALSSTRIHIGMDETHDLGRGNFLDKNGYVTGFELFNRHLCKVGEICEKYNLKPMIWSDMYFRLGSKTREYYDLNSVIPQKVIDSIPENVSLVYWDYYNEDKNFYLDFIEKHRQLNRELIVGSGLWAWLKLWNDHEQDIMSAKPCIEGLPGSRIKRGVLYFMG